MADASTNPVCSSDVVDKILQSEKIYTKPKNVLNYAEDQWSPFNPEGEKKYDREFLLKLQFHPMCLRRPKTLSTSNLPSEMRYRKNKKPLDKKFLEMKLTSPIKADSGLHRSENAWLPSNITDNQKSENIYKKFHHILHQLTPQNFDTLVELATKLNIDTEEKLSGIIYVIIEKFIEEPLFRELYAKICLYLAEICVPLNDKPEQVEFRQVLITRCRMEFEKEIGNESRREKTLKAIDSGEIKKQDELLMKLEVEKMIIWKRISGIVMLIGELFKLNMLSLPIMHECFNKLLSLEDEKSVECLCVILHRIGKELDEVKEKKNPEDSRTPTEQYLAQIQKIVFRRFTSERTLLKLRDLIDSRQNNWTVKGRM